MEVISILAKDLQLLFLWEFADSLHNLMIQNPGSGKQRTTVVTGSSIIWGLPGAGETKLES